MARSDDLPESPFLFRESAKTANSLRPAASSIVNRVGRAPKPEISVALAWRRDRDLFPERQRPGPPSKGFLGISGLWRRHTLSFLLDFIWVISQSYWHSPYTRKGRILYYFNRRAGPDAALILGSKGSASPLDSISTDRTMVPFELGLLGHCRNPSSALL